MPKSTKITPAERKAWLEQLERGVPMPEIARRAVREQRSVREHIEMAVKEREFEAIRRDELREALRSHQADLLTLVTWFHAAIQVPGMDFIQGPDLGLEDLLEEEPHESTYPGLMPRIPFEPAGQVLAVSGSTAFGQSIRRVPAPGLSFAFQPFGHAMKVVRDRSGPKEVRLAGEEHRLCRALREHIGKDAVWGYMVEWKSAVLEDFRARAACNRAIRARAEELFGLKVLSRAYGPTMPYLAHALVRWVRAQVTLGEFRDAESLVRDRVIDGQSDLNVEGYYLVANLPDPQSRKQATAQLVRTIEAVAAMPEVAVARQTYRTVEAKTSTALAELEEYLLIHHISGDCGLCQKLRGQ